MYLSSTEQDVEKGYQLCSRVAQRLNVPQGYASEFHSLRRDRERHVLACWGWAGEMMAFLNILHSSTDVMARQEYAGSLS
jgi:hypothetical protein